MMEEAVALAERGSFAAALFKFREVVADAPGSARAWEAVAQLELEVDADRMAPARAVEAAVEAARLDPAWEEARLTLGRAYLAAGAWREADEALGGLSEATIFANEGAAEDRAAARRLADDVARSERSGAPHFIRVGGRDLEVPRGGAPSPCPCDSRPLSTLVWEAGVVLAKALDWLDLDLRGVDALELGAGTGVAGVAAGFLGARVTLTDRDEDPVRDACARHGAAARAAGGDLSWAPLEWGRRHKDLPRARLVLAADSIYSPAALGPWLSTLDALLAADDRCALLYAHNRRHAALDAAVHDALSARGRLCRVPHHPLHRSDRVDIFGLLRRADGPGDPLAPLFGLPTLDSGPREPAAARPR